MNNNTSVVSSIRMSKFDKEKLKRKMGGFREQLKSTGHSKFALDDKEEVRIAGVDVLTALSYLILSYRYLC